MAMYVQYACFLSKNYIEKNVWLPRLPENLNSRPPAVHQHLVQISPHSFSLLVLFKPFGG